VGQELARSLRLYLGDEVNVVSPLGALGPNGPMPKSRPFRVAGIFYSGMYEYDMKFVYALLPTAQRFLSTGTKINGVEIKVASPDDAPAIATALTAAIDQPQLRAVPWQELNKNLFGALALERLAMFIALGIGVLVASFCIVGTLILMVQEKGREVAVLKAMGATDTAIVGVFVMEGTLIGLFGASLGLALGYTMCFAAEHFGIRLNPEVYYIDRLPVHIDPMEFMSVGISAVLVCLFVTIYPALLASRLRPVEALRYE
jgi:lipoprotein-releasing system permease protein